MPTLVATTTLSRLPLFLSHLPMMVSDSPPLLPGAQREYVSAVSMKLKPSSTNRSSRRIEVDSSAVQPKTLPPNARDETSRPERPSLRFCIPIPWPQEKKSCTPELTGQLLAAIVHHSKDQRLRFRHNLSH